MQNLDYNLVIEHVVTIADMITHFNFMQSRSGIWVFVPLIEQTRQQFTRRPSGMLSFQNNVCTVCFLVLMCKSRAPNRPISV